MASSNRAATCLSQACRVFCGGVSKHVYPSAASMAGEEWCPRHRHTCACAWLAQPGSVSKSGNAPVEFGIVMIVIVVRFIRACRRCLLKSWVDVTWARLRVV